MLYHIAFPVYLFMRADEKLQNRYVDPHIQLKDSDLIGNLTFHDGFPVFGLVEFNIWGACNRRCAFCPISDPTIFSSRKEGIELSDYEKVLSDLEAIDYSGVILWSMFSEPTLHKDLSLLVQITKRVLPNVSLQLTSNGDWFRHNEDKFRELFDLGIDRVNLSLYDGPEQTVEFSEMRRRCGLTTNQVKLRRRYWADGNFGITISNRTGLVDSNAYRDKSESPITNLPLNKTCYYPFYQVGIDYQGDVLLCPHDWSKKLIAGNAFKGNLWEIWKGPHFRRARKNLAAANRSFPPCQTCDVAGDLGGQKNFDAFCEVPNRLLDRQPKT